MSRLLLLVAVVTTAHVWVGTATAASGRTTSVELVRASDGTFAPRSATPRFTLAGVRWRGPGRVVLRTRGADGRWSTWRAGAPEEEDGPDPGGRESRHAGWQLGNPWWVGPSDRIEARAIGRVTRVRAELVWSPEVRIPYRRPALAETPTVVTRVAWGADESIRRAGPTYAPAVGLVIVHHTAGRNDYSRSEAPAIVRGIQLFHVRGNGWNDIGYNFLVDRFGTIYEGRFGGVDRNVVGAHAQGFNTGSVGIAVLGTYGSSAPSRAAQEAVARLIAWRLDLAHVDPLSSLEFVSGGSDRFASGAEVELGAVSGHRDTGRTECPGDLLYARLEAIAARARAIGGAKIFEPSAETSREAVRFRARLSTSLGWSVAITDPDGVEIARGSGTGTAVDWTWDATSVRPATYTWTMSAGAARPATGAVPAGSATDTLEIEEATLEPHSITPNGDGQGDAALLTYRLTNPGSVTLQIVDAVGAVVTTLVEGAWTEAGTHTAVVGGDRLPDGAYSVVLTASPLVGEATQVMLPLRVGRTLGLVTVTPPAFSPNGDGRNDRLEIVFPLARPATARVRIEREGRWIATPLVSELPAGEHRVKWDGTRGAGSLRDGDYRAVVEVADEVSEVSVSVAFLVDTLPPRVRILDAPGVRVEVSEPAVLLVWIDGRALRRQVLRPGVVRIPWQGVARRVRVVAWDAAGNTSGPVLRRLPRNRKPGQ